MNRAELAHTELLQRLNSDKLSFCFLQEPYTFKEALARKPQGYSCYPASLDVRPRVALFTKKSLHFAELSSFTNKNCVAAYGKINGRPTILASIYMDITDNNVISNTLSKLLEFASSNDIPIILGIDTNAHSILYGNVTNKRGEAVEDFILANNIKIENTGRVPTFNSHLGNSIIDVTLSKNLPFSIKNWKVELNFNGSDHRTITFDLIKEREITQPYRPWHKANWPLFTNKLKTLHVNLPEKITDKKLDKVVSRFYKCIISALDEACPMTKRRTRDKHNPWFTDEIEDLRLATV